MMGGYERQSAPGAGRAHVPPADFNGKLLAPDWDRFAEIVANAARSGCRRWPTSASRR